MNRANGGKYEHTLKKKLFLNKRHCGKQLFALESTKAGQCQLVRHLLHQLHRKVNTSHPTIHPIPAFCTVNFNGKKCQMKLSLEMEQFKEFTVGWCWPIEDLKSKVVLISFKHLGMRNIITGNRVTKLAEVCS